MINTFDFHSWNNVTTADFYWKCIVQGDSNHYFRTTTQIQLEEEFKEMDRKIMRDEIDQWLKSELKKEIEKSAHCLLEEIKKLTQEKNALQKDLTNLKKEFEFFKEKIRTELKSRLKEIEEEFQKLEQMMNKQSESIYRYHILDI